jgi:ribonuclease HI
MPKLSSRAWLFPDSRLDLSNPCGTLDDVAGMITSHSENQAVTEPKPVIIHSDGACEGNPGPGGWAAVLEYGKHTRELSGGEPATTNNRMELYAAIAALQVLKRPCAIEFHTDSQYLRQGITEWIQRWKARCWRTIDHKPVKNEDLWRRLDQITHGHRIQWHWLKGHAGHVVNERCDVLARAEIRKIKSQFTADQLTAALEQFRAPLQ